MLSAIDAREHTIGGPGGRALRVRESGDLAGVPLVVHHGTPASRLVRRTWPADAAERGLRLISYDRPGYGGSDRHEGRVAADAAADVAAIADALGIDRFLTHGSSGGGPHALACAALLGDRVAAAATLASCGPYDGEGLDFLAGMGEENVVEFGAALEGPDVLAPLLDELAAGMLSAGPEQMVATLETVLSPPDLAVLSGELGEDLVVSMREGIGERRDGWLDDDIAFTLPWGFELGSISVPVQVWQGGQDIMVPPSHGEWLAAHVPGVDARLSDEDGHMTLGQTRIGEINAWLLERY